MPGGHQQRVHGRRLDEAVQAHVVARAPDERQQPAHGAPHLLGRAAQPLVVLVQVEQPVGAGDEEGVPVLQEPGLHQRAVGRAKPQEDGHLDQRPELARQAGPRLARLGRVEERDRKGLGHLLVPDVVQHVADLVGVVDLPVDKLGGAPLVGLEALLVVHGLGLLRGRRHRVRAQVCVSARCDAVGSSLLIKPGTSRKRARLAAAAAACGAPASS